MSIGQANGREPNDVQDLEQLLATYLDEVEAGRRPNRRSWLTRFPTHAAELADFFSNLDHVEKITASFDHCLGDPPHHADLLPFPNCPGEVARVHYFGDYELIRELGRGGMGIVYAARQVSLDRVLALKLLSPRSGSREDVQRFLREAVAAASLDHPNIVPIYEVGELEGRHYYGMKLVDGGNLATLSTDDRDDLRTLVTYVIHVSRAVQYAHERGVLHRDLKPANVLLDRQGRPYVADFGLARRVDGEAGLTSSGLVLGTPAYMAPEQAEGRREAVTTATDVYGLGSILYEILTGRPPFLGNSPLEILAQVQRTEPDSPSRVRPELPRDLQTIVMKCLEKEPGRRYPSAAAVADDLERWLTDRPITARPALAHERFAKWIRRRPSMAALAVAVCLTTLAAAIAFTASARSARLHEEVRRHMIQRQIDYAEMLRRERDRLEAERLGYAHQIGAVQQALNENRVADADGLLTALSPKLRGWEWNYLRRLGHAELLTIQAHNGAACGVAFAPDPSRFTCPDEHGGLTIWEAGTLRKIKHLRGHDGTAYGVAFDPTGSRIATAGSDGYIRVWDVRESRLLLCFKAHDRWVAAVAFSPDGSLLASAGDDGSVRTWDSTTGSRLATLTGHQGSTLGVAFHPNGQTLASTGQDGLAILWNLKAGTIKKRLSGHSDAVRSVAFHPEGKSLATSGADRLVIFWDLETGGERMRFPAATARVDGLAYSPDGRLLATGGLDRSLKIWDSKTGRELTSYPGHTAPVFSVAFSPDGRYLVSAAQDGSVKLWDARNRPIEKKLRSGGLRGNRAVRLAFSPTGATLAATDGERLVDVFPLGGDQLEAIHLQLEQRVTALGFHPNSGDLALGEESGTLRLVDARTGVTRQTIGELGEPVSNLMVGPRGFLLVASGGAAPTPIQLPEGKGLPPAIHPNHVRFWNLESGRFWGEIGKQVGTIHALDLDPDGHRVAWAGAGGKIHIADVSLGAEIQAVQFAGDPILGLAYRPASSQIASVDQRGMLRLIDLKSNQSDERAAHEGWATSVAFASDGRRLATGGTDGKIRIWDPDRAQPLLTLSGPGLRIASVRFSPDGNILAAASDDGAVSIWDPLSRVP
ncbi:MAG: protein kinase [Isosphaeraceae bacterium]